MHTAWVPCGGSWCLSSTRSGGRTASGAGCEWNGHRGHKYLTVVYQIDAHCRRLLWAGKYLDAWCTRVMRSRIEPMKKVARSLRCHRELILNWFRAKGTISAGSVEGLNNKLKGTFRRSYGFRTFSATQTALYHALGRRPEPQFTHRFF